MSTPSDPAPLDTITMVPVAEQEVPTLSNQPEPVVVETAREAITRIAREQVGILETGCNNCGDGPKKYLASTGLGEGYAYCGAGQYWCMKEVGHTPPGRPADFAWAPNWHTKSRRLPTADSALNADFAGYYYAKLGRIGHTEIIVGESERYWMVIGFNTTNGINRDGHGVFEKMILKTQVTCISRWLPSP